MKILILLLLFISIDSFSMHWRKQPGRRPISTKKELETKKVFKENTATLKLQEFISDPVNTTLGKYHDYETMWYNYYLTIEKLIDEGANPNIKDRYGVPLLVRIIRNLKNRIPQAVAEKIIKKLLNSGSDVNAVDQNGLSALHEAVNYDLPPYVVKILLEYGADVTLRDRYNKTALDRAKDYNFTANINVIENYMKSKSKLS